MYWMPYHCCAGRPEGWAAALLRVCAPHVPAAAPAVRPPPALQAALVQLNMAAAALLARFLPTAAIGAEQVGCSTAGRILGAWCPTLLMRFMPTMALCQLRLYWSLASCAYEAKALCHGRV